jgi:16S rRNA (cytidine1402-2'-O)-methyltransferase
MLEAGKSVAVVSDAGTPAICDPSFRIVERAREIGAPVVPIPGAVAFVNAVIASALPTDSVFFGGFLPSKKSERIRRFEEVRDIPATLVFYETPHRIEKSLSDALRVLGDRRAALARELTKLHEEIISGEISEIFSKVAGNPVKGELVLMFDRKSNTTKRLDVNKAGTLKSRLTELESEGLERKAALKKIAKEFGLSRSEVYRRLLIE